MTEEVSSSSEAAAVASVTVVSNDTSGGDATFGFVTEGVLLTTIAVMGFVGNSMSVYVLLKPSVRGVFSTLLTGLATFDGLFLLCAVLTFGLPTLSEDYKRNVFLTIMPFCYGLSHTFRVGSVYSTLSVTLERFFAIVFPFKDFNTLKKWLIPCTAAFAIIYNIPKFFEVTTVVNPATNETEIVGTALRLNHIYLSAYVFWSKFILIELVPYIIIVILNSFILTKIIKSARFRQKILSNVNQQTQCLGNGHGATNGHFGAALSVTDEQLKFFEKQRQEHKLGILLIAISLLFIVCQSFKLIPDLYEVVFCHHKGDGGGGGGQGVNGTAGGEDSDACYTTPFVNKIVDLSHLLVCINSSANFVIYLLGGEKFRRVWIETYVPAACARALGCHPVPDPRTVSFRGGCAMYRSNTVASRGTAKTDVSAGTRPGLLRNGTTIGGSRRSPSAVANSSRTNSNFSTKSDYSYMRVDGKLSDQCETQFSTGKDNRAAEL